MAASLQIIWLFNVKSLMQKLRYVAVYGTLISVHQHCKDLYSGIKMIIWDKYSLTILISGVLQHCKRKSCCYCAVIASPKPKNSQNSQIKLHFVQICILITTQMCCDYECVHNLLPYLPRMLNNCKKDSGALLRLWGPITHKQAGTFTCTAHSNSGHTSD